MSTQKSVREMSVGAMHEFAIALDKAGFSADLVQRVIQSKDGKHPEAMKQALLDVIEEELFHTHFQEEIVVPGSFNPQYCLEEFRKRSIFFEESLPEEASALLKPTNRLVVRGYSLKDDDVRSMGFDLRIRTLQSFLRRNRMVFLGGVGVMLYVSQFPSAYEDFSRFVALNELNKNTPWRTRGRIFVCFGQLH